MPDTFGPTVYHPQRLTTHHTYDVPPHQPSPRGDVTPRNMATLGVVRSSKQQKGGSGGGGGSGRGGGMRGGRQQQTGVYKPSGQGSNKKCINERWVMLNKDHFQEIFNETLQHEMTLSSSTVSSPHATPDVPTPSLIPQEVADGPLNLVVGCKTEDMIPQDLSAITKDTKTYTTLGDRNVFNKFREGSEYTGDFSAPPHHKESRDERCAPPTPTPPSPRLAIPTLLPPSSPPQPRTPTHSSSSKNKKQKEPNEKKGRQGSKSSSGSRSNRDAKSRPSPQVDHKPQEEATGERRVGGKVGREGCREDRVTEERRNQEETTYTVLETVKSHSGKSTSKLSSATCSWSREHDSDDVTKDSTSSRPESEVQGQCTSSSHTAIAGPYPPLPRRRSTTTTATTSNTPTTTAMDDVVFSELLRNRPLVSAALFGGQSGGSAATEASVIPEPVGRGGGPQVGGDRERGKRVTGGKGHGESEQVHDIIDVNDEDSVIDPVGLGGSSSPSSSAQSLVDSQQSLRTYHRDPGPSNVRHDKTITSSASSELTHLSSSTPSGDEVNTAAESISSTATESNVAVRTPFAVNKSKRATSTATTVPSYSPSSSAVSPPPPPHHRQRQRPDNNKNSSTAVLECIDSQQQQQWRTQAEKQLPVEQQQQRPQQPKQHAEVEVDREEEENVVHRQQPLPPQPPLHVQLQQEEESGASEVLLSDQREHKEEADSDSSNSGVIATTSTCGAHTSTSDNTMMKRSMEIHHHQQRQNWVSLNKSMVCNLVDEVLGSRLGSSGEEEEEESSKDNAQTPPRRRSLTSSSSTRRTTSVNNNTKDTMPSRNSPAKVYQQLTSFNMNNKQRSAAQGVPSSAIPSIPTPSPGNKQVLKHRWVALNKTVVFDMVEQAMAGDKVTSSSPPEISQSRGSPATAPGGLHNANDLSIPKLNPAYCNAECSENYVDSSCTIHKVPARAQELQYQSHTSAQQSHQVPVSKKRGIEETDSKVSRKRKRVQQQQQQQQHSVGGTERRGIVDQGSEQSRPKASGSPQRPASAPMENSLNKKIQSPLKTASQRAPSPYSREYHALQRAHATQCDKLMREARQTARLLAAGSSLPSNAPSTPVAHTAPYTGPHTPPRSASHTVLPQSASGHQSHHYTSASFTSARSDRDRDSSRDVQNNSSRDSPKLGWVAVSKADVHTIVDSVMSSLLQQEVNEGSDKAALVRHRESSQSPATTSNPSTPPPPVLQLQQPAPHRPWLDSRASSSSSSSYSSIHTPPSWSASAAPSTSSSHHPQSQRQRQESPHHQQSQRSPSTSPMGPAPVSPTSSPTSTPASSPGGSLASSGAHSPTTGDAMHASKVPFKWKSSLLLRVHEQHEQCHQGSPPPEADPEEEPQGPIDMSTSSSPSSSSSSSSSSMKKTSSSQRRKGRGGGGSSKAK